MHTSTTDLNNSFMFIISAIILGMIWGVRFFATPEERKAKFKGLKSIFLAAIGCAAFSPFIKLSFDKGVLFNFETITDPLAGIVEHKEAILVTFLLSYFLSALCIAILLHHTLIRKIPRLSRHQAPGIMELVLGNRHIYLEKMNFLLDSNVVPISHIQHTLPPNRIHTRRPIKTGLSIIPDLWEEWRIRRKVKNLYKDDVFNKRLRMILLESSLLNNNIERWTEVEKNSHLEMICHRLVGLFPFNVARFSLRRYNKDTKCMDVEHTSHPEQKSRPIDISKTNSISFSLENDFATVMYSEHPEVHQETKKCKNSRKWINYICKVLVAYPDNPNIPLLSLCFDISDKDSNYILRYLKEIDYFGEISQVINGCFTQFGMLPSIEEQSIILDNIIINKIEKEKTDDSASRYS